MINRCRSWKVQHKHRQLIQPGMLFYQSHELADVEGIFFRLLFEIAFVPEIIRRVQQGVIHEVNQSQQHNAKQTCVSTDLMLNR